MTRRVWAIGLAALAALAILVAVGRWEERHAARKELAGMRTVLAAVGGDPVSRSLSGYRFGSPDCLAYSDRHIALALQLCFDSQGRLIEAVDRRPDQPRYYSVEYKPSLSTIRFPRTEIDQLLQVAAAASG
jgi:hypothetical protein